MVGPTQSYVKGPGKSSELAERVRLMRDGLINNSNLFVSSVGILSLSTRRSAWLPGEPTGHGSTLCIRRCEVRAAIMATRWVAHGSKALHGNCEAVYDAGTLARC